MTPKIVIAHRAIPDTRIEEAAVRALGATLVHTGELESQKSLDVARTADAIMVTIEPVTAEIINMLENCRIIARVGTGLDAINIPAATDRGIWVTNVADYAVDEVSTHAIALLLYHARRLQPMLASVNADRWYDAEAIEPARRLRGQILGLIGYGRIGQAVAAKAKGLGLRVIVHDPYLNQDDVLDHGVDLVDMDSLLSAADYISLHTPLSDATYHVIDADAIAKMKPEGYIINTARGGLVDAPALLDAVRAGAIAGAALDVLETEPPPPDDELLRDDRIVVTPHGAWYSEESKHDVRRKAIEDVVLVLQGEAPRSPVNRPTV